jgi:hypothetical protein
MAKCMFNIAKDRDDILVIDLTNPFSNELKDRHKLAQDIDQALQYTVLQNWLPVRCTGGVNTE